MQDYIVSIGQKLSANGVFSRSEQEYMFNFIIDAIGDIPPSELFEVTVNRHGAIIQNSFTKNIYNYIQPPVGILSRMDEFDRFYSAMDVLQSTSNSILYINHGETSYKINDEISISDFIYNAGLILEYTSTTIHRRKTHKIFTFANPMTIHSMSMIEFSLGRTIFGFTIVTDASPGLFV